MIVPLAEGRNLRIEVAKIGIEQIVFEAAAEFVERLGDLLDAFGDDVLPHAVRRLHFRLDRPVGIDGVAGMKEEIGIMRRHDGIGLHAAVIHIDAEALARGVGRPDEAHRPAASGRRAESPDHRLRSGR